MVSIKDIAKKAGVSISTVSYALNGSPKVTEETCAKILAIAKELNYVPNAAARTLKKRVTNIIGAYLTDFGGAFYGELLQGMKEVLNKKGYDLIVCSGAQSHRLLPERMVDGAIILDQSFASEELLRYADLGHKIVVLDRELSHPNVNQVLLDNKAGAALAVEYLLENGHRNLYIVTGPEGSYDSKQRLQAVKQTVERHQPIRCTGIQGNFDKESGVRAAAQMIREYTGPAAVFCFNDEMAIGIYNALADTEYRVGEHFHIIGFDNIELTKYTQPRLATIDYSKLKWGALASEQLLKLIEGEAIENERIYVTLMKGESVQPV
ncbi:LacI family DNA-binding transcriptional regulator [Paenibacillus xerothermodurans]|uniref:LacI family transcriptional regulator n=1 Tax=Paenibacillus xerothermodurans TaxID=1977292 RepID=A0A2W1NUQ5_PAEXE|nr:LacI family DNA-binding transcriptional regulator [Paenibacillus xerothermodurans]PZE22323.1 LacI family transcriptional regulator [Paenibacillus xerothermodurans]